MGDRLVAGNPEPTMDTRGRVNDNRRHRSTITARAERQLRSTGECLHQPGPERYVKNGGAVDIELKPRADRSGAHRVGGGACRRVEF